MTAADRRLRRAANRRIVCADTGTRSTRFFAQMRGETLASFADIASPSNLRMASHDRTAELELVAGCLHYRPTIDAVVEGARLALLAEAVGTACFDSICDSDLTGFDLAPPTTVLPDTAALQRAGVAMLGRARRYRSARLLADRAADIVTATDRIAS